MIEQLKDPVPYDLLMLADPSEDAIKDYIKRGMTYVYKDQEILGIYVLIQTRPLTFELVNIAVSERVQGSGIGKKMVLHAIKIAREQGGKVLEVGTGNSSLNQLALYQKCGFRITAIDKDFFLKHYDVAIIENGIKCIDMLRLSIDL